MSIESWILNEEEKKKKEAIDNGKKLEHKKLLEHNRIKEKIGIEIEAENKIWNLKDLISKWIISKETANSIIRWIDVDDETINDMFDKIEQIEDIEDIDNYLPKYLRVTKDEYKKALIEETFRIQIIIKINSALNLLSKHIKPNNALPINIFSVFLSIVDRKLIIVQENCIDLRDNLEKRSKKSRKKAKKALTDILLHFFN